MEAIQQDMWQLLVGALTSEQLDTTEKSKERGNLIFFYEFTLMLIEAVQELRKLRKVAEQKRTTQT